MLGMRDPGRVAGRIDFTPRFPAVSKCREML